MIGRNGRIRRAPGFEDRTGRDFERIEESINIARGVLHGLGYQPIETPLIEQTELFLRRSGGLLSSQLFDFIAPDGSDISLRPEMTAPVVRHALETSGGQGPQRFQYAAPIFRYNERPYDAPSSSVPNKRQFIQLGAELVNASQPFADGEIIFAAYSLARRLGVDQVSIRIGHIGFIRELLSRFDLSERARMFLADSVTGLADSDDDDNGSIETEAVRLGLLPSKGQQMIETQASAADLLSRLASGSVRLPESSELTTRSADEIVAGLRRKVEWDARNVDFPDALALIRQIANFKSASVDADQGESSNRRLLETIDGARRLTESYGLESLSSLDNLESVVEAAELNGVDRSDVIVDLGLGASIAYYSGMIFEVSAVVGGQNVVLGRGGRYDGLASALGSEAELPALGFALNLDAVLELRHGGQPEAAKRRYIVVSPTDDRFVADVIKKAVELREAGHNVVSLFDSQVDADEVAQSIGNARVMRVGNTEPIDGVGE
ncbi:MAG: ATP phosphoribosyltransferase regulatory subunit [Chloroflexi bacterium]|nr:ATP phosphoribosyltransferase regulatory subunit [Chloroflexota bacterium]